MSRPSPLPAALEDLIESGLAAQRGGDMNLAAQRFTEALAFAPNNFDALQLLGMVRAQTGELLEGIQLLRKAAEIAPGAPHVLSNLGAALREAGAYRDSVDCLRRALRVAPGNPLLLTNLALSLISVGELGTATRCLERAAKQDPENPQVLYGFGQLMQFHAQPAMAAEAYRRVISRGLKNHDVYCQLGLTLQDTGDASGAWQAFREAETLQPTAPNRLYRAYAGLLCARWDDFERDSAAFEAADERDYLDPFRLLHFPMTGAGQRRHIARFADGIRAKADSVQPPDAPLRPAARRERVRIAYLSPDFRAHPVGVLLAGMLPEHDRGAFEVYAYAWGPKDASGVRERIARACDHFEEVGNATSQDLVARLRAAEIDIAIDLCGITSHYRLDVFGARVAPVQVNWLGYPGTTGLLDYICADATIIPEGSERHFTEQVVRLPQTYLPYDRGRAVSQPRTRKEYGLPDEAVVLACFGQLRKLNPRVFDAWMQVLREVPQAVLWISALTYPAAESALRQAARERGVDPARLIFVCYEANPADHLARYRVADLALDTWPYGSHSTGADALWAGCPLISLAGDSFVTRVSGSILTAAGLPELIARSMDEYVGLIRELARDATRRAALREKLATQRDHCALFDTPRFVRRLETAFRAMHERRLQGLTPAGFDVADDGAVRFRPAAQEEVSALTNRALELHQAGQSAEAVTLLERALGIDPDAFDALHLLGTLRFRMDELQAGIDLLQKACRLKGDHSSALNNLGNALQAARRFDEAIECYRRAIVAPDVQIASYLNLGLALIQKGDHEGAYLAFSRACDYDPTVLSARAPRASLARLFADWTHLTADAQALLGQTPAHDPANIDPGTLLSLSLPPVVQRRYADTYARHLRRNNLRAPAEPPTARGGAADRPLRVAYLSADLREHAVGYLLAPMLEAHDRGRVIPYAYSWYQWPPDSTRARIERSVEQYRDVSGRTDEQLRQLLAEDQIDIAVDLMGHTRFARPSLYTRRVAPVQVGWLGYAGTVGEGMLDWLIADGFIIPEGSDQYYSERVLRLPDAYLPYDPQRPIAAPRTRAQYGLPATGLVLASLSHVQKITPQVFAVWMDLLRELPDAVLWLGPMPRRPEANLRAAASAAGVDAARLILAEYMADNADHLARYRVIDLVLDTFPYGAHSTAADALWAGCPVVALVGDSFASRVSGSILSAAGMPELITRDLSEYRSRLLELAQDAARRQALRARIAENRLSCPLFDLERFTRALEQGFQTIYRAIDPT